MRCRCEALDLKEPILRSLPALRNTAATSGNPIRRLQRATIQRRSGSQQTRERMRGEAEESSSFQTAPLPHARKFRWKLPVATLAILWLS